MQIRLPFVAKVASKGHQKTLLKKGGTNNIGTPINIIVTIDLDADSAAGA